MKRIISLFCVCTLLFMSLAVPARADDLKNSYFFNVLDFTTPNDSGDMTVHGSNFVKSNFTLPDDFIRNYIDVVIQTNFTNLSVNYSTGSFSTSLNVLQIDGNFYRVFGELASVGGTYFDLTFSGTGSFVTFYSVDLCLSPLTHYSVDAYCDIVSAEFNDTIHYVPSDDINYRIFTSTDDYSDTFFIAYIWSDHWKRFDYIDFQLMFECFDITSINAVMGSSNVPLVVSNYDGTAIDGDSFFLSMRLDVSELNRASSDYPMITVMGRLNTGGTNSINFVNCSGFVFGSNINSLYYYFTDLKVKLSDWFFSLESKLHGHFDSLNNWIQLQTDSIGSWFSSLESKLYGHFDSLNNWIQLQTDSIGFWFSSLESKLYGHFDSLNNWIQIQTSKLESAIRGDTSPGDSFQNQVDQKDQELEDMASVMDSVTKPNIQNINVSVDQYVKPVDVQLLTTPLTAFFEFDLFRSIIIMSILLATVSFTLYGKR